ncbi:hypothetical protein BS78_03G341600 [Paspalum vaginatum]|nr:hypothetical protein BS78_03G341600 [Paspalum vaginatum]
MRANIPSERRCTVNANTSTECKANIAEMQTSLTVSHGIAGPTQRRG